MGIKDMEVGRGIVIPAEEIHVRFSRSSGPGGQNVNKRSTRVEVALDLAGTRALGPAQRSRVIAALGRRVDERGVLHVAAESARTQGKNRELALTRLESLLRRALAPPPPPRRPTRATAAARERRIEQKKRRGSIKRLRTSPGQE